MDLITSALDADTTKETDMSNLTTKQDAALANAEAARLEGWDVDHEAVARFCAIDGLTVHEGLGVWLLVRDGATSWWCRATDITHTLLDRYEADRASDDEYEAGQAWTRLCDDVAAYTDDQVDAGAVAAMSQQLGEDGDLSWGW